MIHPSIPKIAEHMGEKYPHLSRRMKVGILTSMQVIYWELGIDPAFMHFLAMRESSYQFWVVHPAGKKYLVIGLCGINWTVWKDSLIARGICEAYADLFDQLCRSWTIWITVTYLQLITFWQ